MCPILVGSAAMARDIRPWSGHSLGGFVTFTALIVALGAGVVGPTPVPRPHAPHAAATRPAADASDLAATAGCPHTIWHGNDTPAATITTASPFELGVKFRADRDGYVTGVRFYKGVG